jgi:hypothetical protein
MAISNMNKLNYIKLGLARNNFRTPQFAIAILLMDDHNIFSRKLATVSIR